MTHSHALLIQRAPIAMSEGQPLYDVVIRHPAIAASARALIELVSHPSQTTVNQDGVYVFQKEYAVVPRARAGIVGSDRATTCHILIVASPTKLFCAHLDGSHGQPTALMATQFSSLGKPPQ